MVMASEDLELNRIETDGVESAQIAEDRDDATPHLVDTSELQR